MVGIWCKILQARTVKEAEAEARAVALAIGLASAMKLQLESDCKSAIDFIMDQDQPNHATW